MMHSIRRSCHSALRTSNGLCAYNGSCRVFSRTAPQSKGGIPVYLKPSTTELASLLSTINSKVLLPEHLSKEQQKLVYPEKSRSKLETEPVEVTIGEVTLPLEPLQRTILPNRWDSLKSVIRQSETKEDWENVVRLLEGFHAAGINIKPQWQDLIVRKLNETGNHSLVLKALQRVRATGLRLSNYDVTRRTLKGAHDRAALSDWEKEETAKSLRYARQIVELMEEKDHHAVLSKGVKMAQTDWRSKPFIIAVPTELAAVAAQKHEGDVETVSTFAKRLVYALQRDNFTESIDRISAYSSRTETDFKNRKEQVAALNTYADELFELLTIWNALKTSRSVLGADMPLAAAASEFEDKIKTVLFRGFDAIPNLLKKNGTELKISARPYLEDQLKKCQA